MNTNEIVKALKICANDRTCDNCPCESQKTEFGSDCLDENMRQAADEIERLQKELDAAVKDIRAVLHDEADCCQICKFDGQCKPDIICHCSEAEWRGRESEGT